MPWHRMMQAQALAMLGTLRWGALVVTVVLIAVSGAASWKHMLDRAEAEAEKNAALIAEYMYRLVQTQDVLLTAADEALREFQPEGGDEERAHLFLRRLYERVDSSFGVALVADDGRFVVSSQQYPATGNVGKRDYLQPAEPGEEVFVDRVVIHPQNQDALVVARRPSPGEGGGVWVSAVEVAAAHEFLQRIAAREGDAASILRADGKLLVRHLPMETPVILTPDTAAMRTIADGTGGIYRATAQTDGVRRIYAAARVGDLPLYANFGVAWRGVLTDWALVMAMVVALLGTIGVATYLLAQYAARSLRAEAAEAANAFDRRLLEEAEKTAAIKDAMLSELNHRVKNSLQMIQALINLQRGRPTGPDLDEIAARVMAIGAIHDLLHRSQGEFEVDLAALLHAICANPAVTPPDGRIEVVVRAEPVVVDVSVATPLALCVVELVTNAAKHAYGPEGGRVEVTLEKAPEAAGESGDGAVLAVADAGRGLEDDGGRRSGLRIVEALVKQSGARMRIVTDGGTRFEIALPAADPGQDRIAARLAAS